MPSPSRGGESVTLRQPRAPLAAGWALRRIGELLDQTPLAPGPKLPPEQSDPLPPRRLRARAGAGGRWEYFEGGRQAAAELAAGLGAAQRSPSELRAVLDFGCGVGRVLPHFAALAPRSACAGCDVDQSAVAWASTHRPGIDWALSSFAPPLPYQSDRFDLVYSISVFSHLGSELQAQWLRELARVLAPGGVALLSVHGPHAFDAFRAGTARTAWCPREVFVREPLRASDFVFVPYLRSVWNAGELPSVGREYGLAFHGPEYIRSAWGRELRVVDVLARALTGWQDLVVCMKR